MIRLTDKGIAVFEATHHYSENEIRAIHTLAYEKGITTDNFPSISGLPHPNDLLKSLARKGLIKGE